MSIYRQFRICTKNKTQVKALDVKKKDKYFYEKRIIFNSLVESNAIYFSKNQSKKIGEDLDKLKEEKETRFSNVLPLYLQKKLNIDNEDLQRKLNIDNEDLQRKLNIDNEHLNSKSIGTKVTNESNYKYLPNESSNNESFPFHEDKKIPHDKIEPENFTVLKEPIIDWNPPEVTVKEDIRKRMKAYNERTLEPQIHIDPKSMIHEKKGFDYLLSHIEREQGLNKLLGKGEDAVKYGSPNHDIPVSEVPCGGCGSLLHCQDPSLPGK